MLIAAIVGGIILACMGAFYTLGLISNFGAHGRIVVDILGLLGLGLLPLALGLGGIWYGKQQLSQRRQAATARHDAALERAIRQATQSNPKGVTVEACVANTPFSAQEVQAKLENLHLDGKLEMDVTEEGQIIYKPKPF
jgi:hypothetical protein